MLQILVLNEKDAFAHATKRLELLQMQECFESLHTYETCCIPDETRMASWTYRHITYILVKKRYIYETHLLAYTLLLYAHFAYDCSLHSYV